MQLTNCRQVTQIIHAVDDDDDGKEAQAGEDAMGMKWDRMGWDGMGWNGKEWETTPGPSALHELFYSFSPFSSCSLLWQRPSKGHAKL